MPTLILHPPAPCFRTIFCVYFHVARIAATYPKLTFDKCGLQEWHCTLRGPAGTDFEAGLYHFRIWLPAAYPFRPPNIMLLTPNGRFELNTKVNAYISLFLLDITR